MWRGMAFKVEDHACGESSATPVLQYRDASETNEASPRGHCAGTRVVSCSLQTSGYIPGQIRLICHLY